MTAVWKPRATAPKDGTAIDLWAKQWNWRTDKFHTHRFTNFRWCESRTVAKESGVPHAAGAAGAAGAGWADNSVAALPDGWFVTHWMPLPDPPEAT